LGLSEGDFSREIYKKGIISHSPGPKLKFEQKSDTNLFETVWEEMLGTKSIMPSSDELDLIGVISTATLWRSAALGT